MTNDVKDLYDLFKINYNATLDEIRACKKLKLEEYSKIQDKKQREKILEQTNYAFNTIEKNIIKENENNKDFFDKQVALSNIASLFLVLMAVIAVCGLIYYYLF